jgi:hypothetical protein
MIAILVLPKEMNADWYLISSNLLSSGSQHSTNLGARMVSPVAMREDVSPELSVLFFPSNQVQVFLNHPAKTFVRQQGEGEPAHAVASTNSVPVRESTVLAGLPAEAHHWTNGPGAVSLWLTAAAPFLTGSTNPPGPFPPPAGVSPNLAVGARAGSNHLVLATEHVTQASVWKPGLGADPPTLLSNVAMTVRSTLVSLVETNFPPSVFQIPADYKEVASLEPPPVKIDPAIFGHEPVGSNFTQSIRKRHEKGGPLFKLPKGSPVWHKMGTNHVNTAETEVFLTK